MYIGTSSEIRSRPWLDYTYTCIKHGGRAVGFERSIDIKLQRYDQLWTNVMRSPVILPVRRNENTDIKGRFLE